MAQRNWLRWSSAGLCVVALGFTADAHGETKAERLAIAKNLVSEALNLEVYGQSSAREKLLQDALINAPALEAAHWHLGHVHIKGKWLTFEEASAQSRLQPRLDEYRQRRSEAVDTVAGQLALADWCSRNKLDDQERAHLSRVVELSPDHAVARERLGHLLVDGQWLTADQRRENAQRVTAERKALADWQPEMRDIARGLQRGALQRTAAESRLRKIHDVAAIPAMELVISPVSEAAARLVVETIAAMDQHEASVALARQAVYSPHDAVRALACEELRAANTGDVAEPDLSRPWRQPSVSACDGARTANAK
jgi:hypothetical protein